MKIQKPSIFLRMTILMMLILSIPMGLKAQYLAGNRGLLNIPDAEMNETGTIMLGGNFVPEELHPFHKYNTFNYFLNVTFFRWLEVSYRCTLNKTTKYTGKRGFYQQDRSISAKLRLLKEKPGKWYPSCAIGVMDPNWKSKDSHYATIYGELTKGFSIWPGDRLALTAGYMYALNDRAIQDGVIGGLSYSPSWFREGKVIVEYDTLGWNAGLAARLWKHLSFFAFTNEGKNIAGGIRVEFQLIH